MRHGRPRKSGELLLSLDPKGKQEEIVLWESVRVGALEKGPAAEAVVVEGGVLEEW